MHVAIRRTTLVLLLVALGCGAHRLSQAQDAFNASARLEAQSSLEDAASTGDPLSGDVQALAGYRVAKSIAEDALERHAAGLKADGLTGTALMLKALCEWRIVALDENADESAVRELVDSIKAQADAQEIRLGTRDRVLLEALPGLTEHELALRREDPHEAGELFESAIETLGNALVAVQPPADHPVRIYIGLAQLRSLRAWRWVEYEHRPPGTDPTQWHEQWNERYTQYREPLLPFADGNPRVRALLDKMAEEWGVSTPP